MTLALDLKTWFKVTAYPIPKGTLWVKYEPNWTKGREDVPRTGDLGLTDGETDGQTDHYEEPAEWNPIKVKNI